MTEWYYVYKEKQMGPFNSYEFELLVIKGEVDEETLVWNSTMSDWQRFDSINYKPPVPEIKKTEIRRDNLNTQKRSDLNDIEDVKALPTSINFVGLLVLVLTLHRVYLLYGDFMYLKFIFQGMIPPFYIILFVLSLVITTLWFITARRFIKRNKKFLSTLRKTASLSCLPMILAFVLHGNIRYIFSLNPNNINLIYIIIAVLSFSLLKDEKFSKYFKN